MAQPFEPTPEEVKALIPTRLQGRDFSESSIPTRVQVLAMISDVADDIFDRVDAEEIPEKHLDRAKRAVLYETASRLELGFWPEQQRGDTPPTVQWHERAEKVIDRLQESVKSYDPDVATTGAPSGVFPRPSASGEIPETSFVPLASKDF